MPIVLPKDIPAYQKLRGENIFVMDDSRALAQDIRPIEILILNLMPTKIETEIQLLRVLSNSALQIKLTFISTQSYIGKHTQLDHLDKFYQTFDQVKKSKFDGFIITGAPVEQLSFHDVKYWKELQEIFDYAKEHVTSTLYVCWGAQAVLYHHFDIPKIVHEKKLFGVYQQEKKDRFDPLLRGIDDYFNIPQSSYSGLDEAILLSHPGLKVLSFSNEAGPSIIKSLDGKHVFITGHLEYDRFTLKKEYERDLEKGLKISPPVNYFLEDGIEVNLSWNATAHLIFTNWLNYYVYQITPYELEKEKQT